MIYKRYPIKRGDTLQVIAQYYLGDSSEWINLVSYNNLKYPYINRLSEEKYNIPNVLQVGDDILIPIPDGQENSTNIELLNGAQKYQVSSYVLGRDLNITENEEDIQRRGTTDETLELPNSVKDLKVVGGYDNLKQAIIIRLNTPQGSLLLHPEYGNTFSDIIGQPNTESNIRKLLVGIEKTLRQDERIKNVKVVANEVNADTVRIELSIEPINFSDQFTMYLKSGDKSIILDE